MNTTAAGAPADCLARRALAVSAVCTAVEIPLGILIAVDIDYETVAFAVILVSVFAAAFLGAIVALLGIAWHGRKGLLGPGLVLLGINMLVLVPPILAVWRYDGFFQFH